MATAKEIEEIIGISSRTIESWSNTRDDKYLLAKLLKSYSKIDLKNRIQTIIEDEEIEIVDKKAFFEGIIKNFQDLFPDVSTSEISDFQMGIDSRTVMGDLVVRINDTIYFLNEASQIPSQQLIIKRCGRLLSIAKNADRGFYKEAKNIKCIYITAKKNAGVGEDIDLYDILKKMKSSALSSVPEIENITTHCVVTVMDIDSVAEKIGISSKKIVLK